MKKYKGFSFVGYLIFFLTIFVAVSASVAIYSASILKFGERRGVVTLIMIITISFIALTCTVIDIFRRKIMVERPTERILEGTRKMAQGDFSVRFPISHSYGRYDEYDLISDNLNKLSAELSKTEVLSSDFISNVSHEMKTPLAVIQSYASAISSKNLSEEERREYALVLVDTAKKLTALVTNVLKLNKLENQSLLPKTDPIRLDDHLAQAVIGFDEVISEKNLELDCDFDEVTVLSDGELLEIVWNNLLSNAVKFSENGGKISLSVKRKGEFAVVLVEDEGVGISPEDGLHIFDKFYQVDGSHSKEGNGLGLALVKRVIDILGGEISVESLVGKGSAFTVKLKLE